MLSKEDAFRASASLEAASWYLEPDRAIVGYQAKLLPDYYITSRDENGLAEKFGFNEDGTRQPAFYKTNPPKRCSKYIDGKEIYFYNPTGIYVLNSKGVRLPIFDQVLSRLAKRIHSYEMPVQEIETLWNHLTSDGSHGPIFTGKLLIAINVGSFVEDGFGRRLPYIYDASIPNRFRERHIWPSQK